MPRGRPVVPILAGTALAWPNAANPARMPRPQAPAREVRMNARARREPTPSTVRDKTAAVPPPERLLDFVENGAVGLHCLGPDGTILWANRAEYEMFGYSAEEYVGRQIADLHVDSAAAEELLHRLCAGETLRNVETQVRCRDGSVRKVLVTSNGRFDEHGRFLHAHGFSQEPVEQKSVPAKANGRPHDLLGAISHRIAETRLADHSTFDEVAREIGERFGDLCAIRVLSKDGLWLVARGFYHSDPAAREFTAAAARRAPAGEGPSARVLASGKALRMTNLQAAQLGDSATGLVLSFFEKFPVQEMLLVPLIVQGRRLGTVVVARSNNGPYTAADEELLRELADRIAAAITLAEQHAELTLERERLSVAVERAHSTSVQLNMIAEALPALMSYVGPDLRYRFTNSAYERWFGLTKAEIAGKSLLDLLGPVAFEAIRPHFVRALGGETVTFEEVISFRNAGERSVRVTYTPQYDTRGAIEGIVVLVNDVSEERRASAEREELLRIEREARERLTMLARASEILAESLDYERTLDALPALLVPDLGDYAIFDLQEAESVRTMTRAQEDTALEPLLALRSAPAGELNLNALTSGCSGYHPQIDEAWLRRVAADEERLAELKRLGLRSMMTVPLAYEGRTMGAMTLFMAGSGRRHGEGDLTLAAEIARRAAAAIVNARLFKEARDAIGVRDDFLSMAGHELRTPLTALQLQILSITKMVGQQDSAEKVAARAEKAGRNVLRLGKLVNELLDISRISSGRLRLERTPFELGEAVREVVASHAEELAKSGCELKLSAPRSVVGSWDRLRVEQVVTNLLTNAIKYGQGKPIEVSVERADGAARIIVRDHGIGIPAEDQNRIFQRFERAVSSRHFGGLGFGLWIARQLVDAHGGDIRVASEQNRGATFEVELPLVSGSETAA